MRMIPVAGPTFGLVAVEAGLSAGLSGLLRPAFPPQLWLRLYHKCKTQILIEK
jgi:hypothetical protein